MAKEKKDFLLPYSLKSLIKKLDQKQKGDLLDAILAFEIDGDVADFSDYPRLDVAFDFVKDYLNEKDAAYSKTVEQKSESGKKGAAARWGSEPMAKMADATNAITSWQDMANMASMADMTCNDMSCNDLTINDNTPSNSKESDRASQTPYLKIVDLYHQNCVSLPKVKQVSDRRKKAMRTVFKHHDLEEIDQAFKKAEGSDFISGRSGRWTSCNFDWLMKEKNMVKVLEGTYDNKANDSKSQSSWLDAIKRGVFDE